MKQKMKGMMVNRELVTRLARRDKTGGRRRGARVSPRTPTKNAKDISENEKESIFWFA